MTAFGGGTKAAQIKHQRQKKSTGAATLLSLHTDQQSLILGDLLTHRNRLREENQELRDRLQDADMVIRLLSMKLDQRKRASKNSSTPTNGSSTSSTSAADDFLITEANIMRMSNAPAKKVWSPLETKRTNGTQRRMQKKESFRNSAAPGKKMIPKPAPFKRQQAAAPRSSGRSKSPTKERKRQQQQQKGTRVADRQRARSPTKRRPVATAIDTGGGGSVKPEFVQLPAVSSQTTAMPLRKDEALAEDGTAVSGDCQYTNGVHGKRVGQIARVVMNQYST